MERKQGVFLSMETVSTWPENFAYCCDECGGLCRDTMEILTPSEMQRFISEQRKTARRTILSRFSGLH